MNVPGRPRAQMTQAEVLEELQHVIEANETTRILVQESCQALTEAVEMHLREINDHVRRLAAELKRR